MSINKTVETITVEISATRRGFPAVWVGGGALTNTFHFRTVIRGQKERCSLLRPLIVKTHGSLAAETEQALVVPNVGDIIVSASGRLPVDDNNPDADVDAMEIVAFTSKEGHQIAEGVRRGVLFADLPVKVIEGASRYHNRDGECFCDA